jgi:hypothetical protein
MTDRWKCRQDEHGVAVGSNGSRFAGSLATVAQTPHCSARPRSRSQDLLHPQIDRLEFGRPNAHPASQCGAVARTTSSRSARSSPMTCSGVLGSDCNVDAGKIRRQRAAVGMPLLLLLTICR